MVEIRKVAPSRVVLVTAVIAAVIMGDSMIYNVLPANVSTFGISVGLVGVLLSANRIVRLATNPLAAWTIQRFGTPVPMLTCVILAIGTTITFGLAKGFVLLLAARILWGVCYSIFRLTGYLIVLEESHDGSRGRLMGFFSGGQRMGSLVGVLLGGILFDVLGRSSSFLIIASLGLLSIPASLALARRPGHRDFTGSRAQETRTQPSPLATREGGFRRRTWDLLVSPLPNLGLKERRQLLVVNFTFFAFHLVMSGILVATLGFFLSQRLGEEAVIAGIVLGIATLNGLLLATRWVSDVGSPYLGYLGDRLGQERVLLVTMPICAVALLLLASSAPLGLALSWLPLTFVATAASFTSLSALAGGLAPVRRRPQVMSRFATWQDVGSASGPLLAYAALSSVSPEPVYLGGALFMLAALGFFIYGFSLLPLRQRGS